MAPAGEIIGVRDEGTIWQIFYKIDDAWDACAGSPKAQVREFLDELIAAAGGSNKAHPH